VYRTFVFLHLVGVVLFFSGFSASLFLKFRADQTGERRILAHTLTQMNFNDRWLTPPAILLILVGGFGAAEVGGLSVTATGWLLWPLILFGISGAIFAGQALPLQLRLERLMSAPDASEGVDWAGYRDLSRRWTRWATVAFLLVSIAFVLMVFKPDI